MIDANEKKEAKQNFDQYLQDGLIKKEKNETAKAMYIKNAEQGRNLAYPYTVMKCFGGSSHEK